MIYLEWLYSTIPFTQLMGTRANILGLVWFLGITGITMRHLLRNDYTLGIEKKTFRYTGILGISVLSTWVFYRMMDIMLALIAFTLNKPQLVGNFTAYFWFAECFDVALVLLSCYYLLHVLKLKPFFTMRVLSLVALSSTIIIQFWAVSNFSIDYAGLVGSERIRVFWSYYPLLYLSYALLFLTLLKGRTRK